MTYDNEEIPGAAVEGAAVKGTAIEGTAVVDTGAKGTGAKGTEASPDKESPEAARALIDLGSRLNTEELQMLLEAFAARVREESRAARLLATAGDFSDLRQIKGRETSYWYSQNLMTESYAGWAMLAREDDVAQTLVQCAREESRTYPRPLSAHSLSNAPFHLTAEALAEAFERIRESGEFPDIERLVASNGDVYYFSNKHLRRVRAEALAEYYSVDVYYNA
jgi:hypothetical protein